MLLQDDSSNASVENSGIRGPIFVISRSVASATSGARNPEASALKSTIPSEQRAGIDKECFC